MSVVSWIMVTGGAGYIGKHIVINILEKGYGCVIIDNLSRSSGVSLKHLKKISGLQPSLDRLHFHKIDIRDTRALELVFQTYEHRLSHIIHLAALKSIPESMEKPDLYYDVNVTGTNNLIKLSQKYGIKNFVFSSTAAVYSGTPSPTGYQEEDVQVLDKLEHAYAKSKRQCEILLEEAHKLDPSCLYVALRYFNPIGNIGDGEIGENFLKGDSTGLMFSLGKNILGLGDGFYIYGDDYPDSPDGTAMRDFIDVNDLAAAHLEIISSLIERGKKDYYCYNLGTGTPTSVGRLVDEVVKLNSITHKNNKFIPKLEKRRPGDQAISFANTSKVRDEIGWTSKTSLTTSCQSFINRCKFLDSLTYH